MKKIVVIALIINAFATIAAAQPDPERREERIRAFRAAIFTEELSLTSKEAEAFWPVYYEFLDNREKTQQQYRSDKPLDNMNDAEVEDQIKRHFEQQQRELDLERDLYQKLRSVLPARKIAKLPHAERRFREALVSKLKELKERRGGGNPNKPWRQGQGGGGKRR